MTTDSSTLRKELGKIGSVKFGWGGYQDCQVGLSLTFTMRGSAVGTFMGAWGTKWTERCEWTEESRLKEIGLVVMQIAEWLKKIHCEDVHELVGIPVELTFDGNLLKDWRLLEEVL